MCLAVVAWLAHPRWRLVVIANRDEFHDRPAQAMQPWRDAPNILAGRDMRAGGTWLGLRTDGRFALLTNFRDPNNNRDAAPSRGQLVEQFLRGNGAPVNYLQGLAPRAGAYNGFNLLVGDGLILAYGSNKAPSFVQTVNPGVQGLSNALLNTPWPKTQKTVRAVSTLLTSPNGINADALLGVMQDTEPVADKLLPRTGVTLERERLLATPFIRSPSYGTRCTTLALQAHDQTTWVQEDSYDREGRLTDRQRWLSDQGQPWCTFHVWPGSL